jgi:trehalose 6-phosphate phosphatase
MLTVTRDALPLFRHAALLLDLDGTLLDIAPTPEAVLVPPGLIDTLLKLGDLLDGAVAAVTGRAVEAADAILGDLPVALAAEHGGAIRFAPGAVVERPNLAPPPEAWYEHAEALHQAFPGTIMERKPRGFVLHFRLAPEAEPVIHEALTAMIAGSATFEMLPGRMICEVRPRGVDKGIAVATIMARAPFAGRSPVFIGDDVTDEDGMRAARAMGGAGFRVQDVFGDAAGVRAWLTDTASRGDWGTLP